MAAEVTHSIFQLDYSHSDDRAARRSGSELCESSVILAVVQSVTLVVASLSCLQLQSILVIMDHNIECQASLS